MKKELKNPKAAAYAAAWRAKNPERSKANSQNWLNRDDNRKKHHRDQTLKKRMRKQKLIEHMGGACVDCKNKFHQACMDFHHIDPSKKEFKISWLSAHAWERVLKELEQCVLLCSNCHRLRHFKDLQDIE